MNEFSEKPGELVRTSRERGYVGLHFEQGVPVVDRDVNLASGLATALQEEVLLAFFGDGVGDDGFAVTALPGGDAARNDFIVSAGTFSIGGVVVENPQPLRYSEQGPPLTSFAPPSDGPTERRDLVYLEIWPEDVDGSSDPDLLNRYDIGTQTSTRRRLRWSVRVAEGGDVPAALAPDHAAAPLAEITRLNDGTGSGVERWMIRDLRPAGRWSIAETVAGLERVERALGPQVYWVGGGARSGGSFNLGGERFGDPTVRRPGAAAPGPGVSLGGIELAVAYADRGAMDLLLPRGFPQGSLELAVTTLVGTTRRMVRVREDWVTVDNGVGRDVALVPNAGSLDPLGGGGWPVWVIGHDIKNSYGHSINYWAPGVMWPEVVGAAERVACDIAGRPWVINQNPPPFGSGQVFHFDGASFGAPLGTALDIACGAQGDVWKVEADGSGVSKWNGAGWDPVLATPRDAYRVAVAPDGALWVVMGANSPDPTTFTTYEVRRYDPVGQTWDMPLPIPPGEGRYSAADITVGDDGTLWIIGNEYSRVYAWRSGQWLPSDCYGRAISAGRGEIWVVDLVGVIRRREVNVMTEALP